MSEKWDVQQPLIDYAQEIGWEYFPATEALKWRGGDTNCFFNDLLHAKLIKLNPGVVDEERAAEILRQLNLIRPTIQGNQQALDWLRGEHSVFVPAEGRELNVKLVDFDNPDNNEFHVTDEWWQKNPAHSNRADVVFLINGMPVAVVETKAAAKPDGLALGIDQIRRYHRETPEMFISTQVFDVSQLLDLFYGASWSTSRKNLFNWKDECPEHFEGKVKAFFNRTRFLKVLKDYIIFYSQNEELTKMILRQHQTRAVEKVIQRVQDQYRKRGLIWHTQGSGKTLTMITIASQLLKVKSEAKPTVLMLIDRNELQSQMVRNIEACGITNYRMALSKADLRNILASDYRGLIVSMVHKFDEIPASINASENFVVLVDEAHRTTGGDLGNFLMAALPNASYIGFTGTPIDRLSKGKGTFKVFGRDDEAGYLDKYSIAESIEDGTTVKLNYALAPNNLRIDQDILKSQFLDLMEAEGVSDIDELNAILDCAVELKEMMKSPQRVDQVARYVSEHFLEYVEPMGFKAFMVGVDRTACAMYKEALDKYLPPEYSQVVYSGVNSDEALLKRYWISEDQEKKVRKDFTKKDLLPKILIVTEKLLTGYDAPILYCMYLDKPMRDHVLLQTIARVNRPYEDEEGLVKSYGLVLDFVGIFENLERALAFDSDVVASVIQNIDVLKNLFGTLMAERAPDYLPLLAGGGDKAKERAIEHFADETDREEFYRFFKQIQALYDILSPDAFLRPYIGDYQTLAELYGLIREAYSNRPYVDKELTQKTRQLLQKHTEGINFELPGAIHELGAEELRALKTSGNSATTKILNLSKVLSVAVETQVASRPFLLGIGERADALRKAYEDRIISTQDALQKFLELAQEYVEADEQRRQINVDENTFAIFSTVKLVKSDLEPKEAVELDALFQEHPDFVWSDNQQRHLRTQLYKMLLKIVGKERYIAVANTLMKLRRV